MFLSGKRLFHVAGFTQNNFILSTLKSVLSLGGEPHNKIIPTKALPPKFQCCLNAVYLLY